jgi:hypothetical protein
MGYFQWEDWQPLPPLGDYYGEDWFVYRRGEAAKGPPEQAARARANPLPPNLETYVAALTRGLGTWDKSVVVEWSRFVLPDIERVEWITSMITDHRVAKHTANALMLYPSLEDHCPRCTQIHDKGHRRYSREFCALLSPEGTLAGILTCKYVYCSMLPKHARIYYPKINLL